MTFGTVPAQHFWLMLSSMAGRSMTVEQYLLSASGLMAISLVALASAIYNGLWPGLAIHLAFAIAFVLGAFKEILPVFRHQGVAAILVMLALSVVALAIYRDTIVLILSVVLMASAPYHLSARQSWLLMLAANVVYFLTLNATGSLGNYAIAWLTLVALQGFAITSSLARQREVLVQETLARQNNELLAARAVMAQQSQAEERLRIAGDLHDTIGHRLTALQLQLEALAHQAPETLRPQVAESQALAGDLLEDIRAIVRKMSDEKRGDLASAIQQLEKLTPGVEISITSALPELDTALAQQLVFCFQEGIHNAIRHGKASRIEIGFGDSGFSIRDNGRGLRGRVVNGFGLTNIGQRLAPFGGSARLSEASSGGSELFISLPESAA